MLIESETPMTTEPDETARTAPDLTDYHAVHRAMIADLRRLAEAADRVAVRQSRPDPALVRALGEYLACVACEIRSHHQVEEERFGPLLDTALDLTRQLATTPDHRSLAAALASVLHFLAGLLDRHISTVERSVVPVIRHGGRGCRG